MKVVLLIHRLTWGGTQRQLVALARGFTAAGHRVTVLSFYPGGPFEDELRKSGIDVRDLGKSGRYDVIGFVWRAARTLRALRSDVVYSFLIAPNLVALLLRPLCFGVPVVWGVRASNMDHSRYDRWARLTFRIGCRLARRADRIIANSVAGANYHLAQGYPQATTCVVPNGIDTSRFRPDAEAGEALRTEWGVPAAVPLIGVVGRLDPMKDHATFLSAAAQLAPRRPDARFVVVGAGPEDCANRLRRLAGELGLADRVIWAGARRDTEAVFNALDVVTSSSAFGEGFPNVVGEALACERPCVVTDVGDAALLVADPTRTVAPRDPAGLAAAWERVLGDARPTQARQRIVEDYSIAALVRQTEAELNRVLSTGARFDRSAMRGES